MEERVIEKGLCLEHHIERRKLCFNRKPEIQTGKGVIGKETCEVRIRTPIS
jgi:hypothetical protein